MLFWTAFCPSIGKAARVAARILRRTEIYRNGGSGQSDRLFESQHLHNIEILLNRQGGKEGHTCRSFS